MRVEWDDAKDLLNQAKHGISFGEARRLFESGVDYLEVFDSEHSDAEDRFIAIDHGEELVLAEVSLVIVGIQPAGAPVAGSALAADSESK